MFGLYDCLRTADFHTVMLGSVQTLIFDYTVMLTVAKGQYRLYLFFKQYMSVNVNAGTLICYGA